MAGNILENITEQYHTLTRSGKKMADYIFDNTDGIQYLSISTLAENAGVSEATITRFCRSLGLSGYNEFKLELAKADRMTDLGDPSAATGHISSNDSLHNMFLKIHGANLTSQNETYDLLDEEQIAKAAQYLIQADRIFCLGQGGSMVMAMEAWARFSTVSSRFVHISDSHMQSMAISLASEKDVILFFSYSGSTRDMEDLMQLAMKQNVKVVLITHFPKSRAAEFADIVLLCGFNESPLQSGSIAAKIGQLFLIECLFYSFCREIPEQASKYRSRTAEAVAKKLL